MKTKNKKESMLLFKSFRDYEDYYLPQQSGEKTLLHKANPESYFNKPVLSALDRIKRAIPVKN